MKIDVTMILLKILKDSPDEIEKLEEASNNYISENDQKILKKNFLINGII